MMEIYILAGFNVLMFGLLVFKEVAHIKERDTLTSKLMAKNFLEYSGHELAKLDPKPKKPVENHKRRV